MLRNRLKSRLFAFSLLMFTFVSFSIGHAQNRDLELVMFDMGQGESLLIVCPSNKLILVDSGSRAQGKGTGKKALSTIDNIVKERGIKDRKIDYLFITHPHADHFNKISEIKTKYQIGEVISPLIPKRSNYYGKVKDSYWNLVEGERFISTVNIDNFYDDYKKDMDLFKKISRECSDRYREVDFVLLAAGENYKNGSDLNDLSIVFGVKYALVGSGGRHLDYKDEFAFILTGDATSFTKKKILDSVYNKTKEFDNRYSQNLKSQLLKISHHGSVTGLVNAPSSSGDGSPSPPGVLDPWHSRVRAEFNLVSSSRYSRYMLPNCSVLDEVIKVHRDQTASPSRRNSTSSNDSYTPPGPSSPRDAPKPYDRPGEKRGRSGDQGETSNKRLKCDESKLQSGEYSGYPKHSESEEYERYYTCSVFQEVDREKKIRIWKRKEIGINQRVDILSSRPMEIPDVAQQLVFTFSGYRNVSLSVTKYSTAPSSQDRWGAPSSALGPFCGSPMNDYDGMDIADDCGES